MRIWKKWFRIGGRGVKKGPDPQHCKTIRTLKLVWRQIEQRYGSGLWLFQHRPSLQAYRYVPHVRSDIPIEIRRRLSRPPSRPLYLWFHVPLIAPSFILWWPETEILFDPLHRSSPYIGGQRWQPSQMGHSLHIRRSGWGGGGGGIYTFLISMDIAVPVVQKNYR
jgi:hypothetical protein